MHRDNSIKRRIIIEIRNDDISDWEAMTMVKYVIEQGKISKTKDTPQYCFATTFPGGFKVLAREKYKTKADSFVVY